MVNKLWYLAICMQDSHHGTWHYVITVWRHLIFWWIWVPGFQTKILWKLIWSVVFKFKRYFIDYNIAYNIYHTWYMVKRVSVSVVRKEESGFFAPQLHHNAPQFTTHSSRQNKKYYSPFSLRRGRAEGVGAPTLQWTFKILCQLYSRTGAICLESAATLSWPQLGDTSWLGHRYTDNLIINLLLDVWSLKLLRTVCGM